MQSTDLLELYRVDQGHARCVADHALALFDALAERYQLPADARRLLEIGALLHNVGLSTDPPAHHLVGRDIVLRHSLSDLSAKEQAIVACIVAFHRKKVRPKQEPAYLGLPKKQRALALQLAAIVRVADGLDYAQSATTTLAAIAPCEDGVQLDVSGPFAAGDAARAVEKADLWQKVFGAPLTAQAPSADPAAPAPAAEATEALLDPWYAAGDVALAELGRVLLRRHFRRLLQAARAVRADRSIEAVHELRVATRRLRAALRLLEPVAPPPARRLAKSVGQLARRAGAVRDLDVLLADLEKRSAALGESHAPGVASLLALLRSERTTQQRQLVALLNSDAHATFARTFATLMNSWDGWDTRMRVRDLAGSTIWRRYEELRFYDRDGLPAQEAQIHEMRIAGKRLRYSIELFADTFGDRAALVVDPLIAFQDHVGILQDVVVAGDTLHRLEVDPDAGAAAEAYLALRSAQAAQLRAELPTRWEKVASATYRRNLMGLIVKL